MTKADRIRRWFGVFVLTMLYFLTAPNCLRNAAAQDSIIQHTTINVRFQNGIEIFSPQTPIVIEVQPKFSLGPESPLNEKGLCLNIVASKKKQPDEASKILVTELEILISAQADSPWFPVSFLTPVEEGIYEITVSLQRKEDRSTNNRPLLNFSSNPLQRRLPKVIAETVVHYVVLNSNPAPRLADNLDSMKKEILETVETTGPAWRKHLPYISNFPKVGLLSSPKIPELPKLTGFRDRSLPKNMVAGDSAAVTPENKPIDVIDQLVTPLNELYEQWKSGIPGRFGSGNLKQFPISSAQSAQQPAQHPTLSVLNAATEPNSVSWEALPLPICEIDKLYLVELDYPAEIPQTLEIGIVELLNYGDKTVPALTIDSGIHVVEEIVSDQIPGRMTTHRILFWSKTKQPMLLLVNRDRWRDAQFGDFRLYEIEEPNVNSPTGQHSKVSKPFNGQSQRLVTGYIHRACFLDDLSSSTEFRPTGMSIRPTDWQILYESSTRMVTLLRQSGYNGAMINVASNEAMLYPSEKFGDVLYKDSLELLARIFDREQLTLIPSIDFNFPIPELENLIQTNPLLAEELLWSPTDPVVGPRYNLLHPIVQKALFEIIRELVERYSKHPSFGGVAVLLTPDGSARLPLTHRELDDRIFSEFLQDAQKDGLVVPPELTTTDPAMWQQRKAARAGFVQSNQKAWNAWLRWRTRSVQDFYAEVTKIVTGKRPEAKLYLAAGTILDSPEIQSYCLPNLSRWTSPVYVQQIYVLQMLGFDPALLTDIPSLIFLRPHRVSNSPDSLGTASYVEFDTLEAGNQFSKDGTIPGVLFYHDSSLVPAKYRNRRRFVKQLAQADVEMFIDGGQMFPSGEENAIYDLLATFRQIPAVPFQTFLQNEKSLQPITVRYAATPKGLTVYLVNDAPFSVEASLTFSVATNTSLTELSGHRTIDPMTVRNGSPAWQITLQPFDLVAVTLNDPNAVILNVDVTRPPAICGVNGILRQKVDQLSRQIHAANRGILWDKLENPDFETVSSDKIHGWICSGSPLKFNADIVSGGNSGQHCLRLDGMSGVETEPGIIFSEPFEAPITGRLFVSVFIGISDSVTEKPGSLPLDVVLSAKQRKGEPFLLSYRVEPTLLPLLINAPLDNSRIRWHQVVVPFEQLPTEGLEDFRIGFRLYAPGTVWIDNVTMYRMTFTASEIKALQQIVLLANGRSSADRISDLLTILEGYWPQYLFRHVPLSPISASPPVAVAAKETGPYASQVSPPAPPKKEEQSIFNRVRSWFSK